MDEVQSAVAGPSSNPIEAPLNLLLEADSLIPSPLGGNSDLLSLFNLNSVYDVYVRPYLPPSTIIADTKPSIKGKEREVSVGGSVPPVGTTRSIGFSFGGIKIGDQVEIEIEKPKKMKFEKSYTGMISDIPGRNTIKKDHHMLHLVMNPDTQPLAPITPFDAETIRDAFTLLPGQIPAFDGSIFLDNAEPIKKKKKRKKVDSNVVGTKVTEDDDRQRKKKKEN